MKQPTQSVLYYIGRVTQRLLLCFVIGSTIIHWVMVIAIAVTMGFVGGIDDLTFKGSGQLSDQLHKALDMQSLTVLRWTIAGAVATSLLIGIKRYRTYEKPMLVDGLVIMGFCLLSVMLSMAMVNSFVSDL